MCVSVCVRDLLSFVLISNRQILTSGEKGALWSVYVHVSVCVRDKKLEKRLAGGRKGGRGREKGRQRKREGGRERREDRESEGGEGRMRQHPVRLKGSRKWYQMSSLI